MEDGISGVSQHHHERQACMVQKWFHRGDTVSGQVDLHMTKLMEAERPPTNIDQWYKHATNLNRYWRESRKEEERLRGRQEQKPQAPRQNNRGVQWQQIP